ncbi:MAG: ribosome-associated translation inhibitor RaiA [Actinomycetales bacterium]|jgi:ribosomal subunit interface protein|nr:ribosome-associated translation inhibitor RaiA [Actinomycetales bacterium]
MEIVVVGRHTQVPERFRRHVEDKLSKVAQLAPRAQRIDVEVTHERNPRQSEICERVELTVRGKGPVIRAEATADDPYAALDVAMTKLMERLRRARDRRKDHHRAAPLVPVEVRTEEATDGAPAEPADEVRVAEDGSVEKVLGDSPIVIREKLHTAQPMTLDEALYQMEMVGHDFFLFVDAETSLPSVAYRRRGWSYGVIRLDTPVAATAEAV